MQALLDHHDALRLRLVVVLGKDRNLEPLGRAAGSIFGQVSLISGEARTATCSDAQRRDHP